MGQMDVLSFAGLDRSEELRRMRRQSQEASKRRLAEMLRARRAATRRSLMLTTRG